MSDIDTNTLVRTALDAVLAGCKIAETASATMAINNKGSLRDIVTQTDIDISDLLINKLGATGFFVISEEKYDPAQSTPDVFWAVDPIDGTVNFAHGLPQYAVSVGLMTQNVFKLGVVCSPALNELYFTLNPERALLNGKPFAHEHRSSEDALIAASFSAKAPLPQYALFKQVNESTRGCLRTGSAALNICWAASGKLQAAYGFNAKLWDVAGALAIARAAGCEIIVRHIPNTLTLDYCAGSKNVVRHILGMAHENGLWG